MSIAHGLTKGWNQNTIIENRHFIVYQYMRVCLLNQQLPGSDEEWQEDMLKNLTEVIGPSRESVVTVLSTSANMQQAHTDHITGNNQRHGGKLYKVQLALSWTTS